MYCSLAITRILMSCHIWCSWQRCWWRSQVFQTSAHSCRCRVSDVSENIFGPLRLWRWRQQALPQNVRNCIPIYTASYPGRLKYSCFVYLKF